MAVKRRLAYVPDQLAFYPWMSLRETLDYLASFRERWNKKTEEELLDRFQLERAKRTAALSKGQRTQLGLIAAICPETDLLVLDANPLDDIRNTRRIAKLYIAGNEIDRAALKASLTRAARN